MVNIKAIPTVVAEGLDFQGRKDCLYRVPDHCRGVVRDASALFRNLVLLVFSPMVNKGYPKKAFTLHQLKCLGAHTANLVIRIVQVALKILASAIGVIIQPYFGEKLLLQIERMSTLRWEHPPADIQFFFAKHVKVVDYSASSLSPQAGVQRLTGSTLPAEGPFVPPNFALKDPYEIFGIRGFITQVQIKKRRNDLFLRHHSDRNKDPKADEQTRKIKEAYDQLRSDGVFTSPDTSLDPEKFVVSAMKAYQDLKKAETGKAARAIRGCYAQLDSIIAEYLKNHAGKGVQQKLKSLSQAIHKKVVYAEIEEVVQSCTVDPSKKPTEMITEIDGMLERLQGLHARHGNPFFDGSDLEKPEGVIDGIIQSIQSKGLTSGTLAQLHYHDKVMGLYLAQMHHYHTMGQHAAVQSIRSRWAEQCRPTTSLFISALNKKKLRATEAQSRMVNNFDNNLKVLSGLRVI